MPVHIASDLQIALCRVPDVPVHLEAPEPTHCDLEWFVPALAEGFPPLLVLCLGHHVGDGTKAPLPEERICEGVDLHDGREPRDPHVPGNVALRVLGSQRLVPTEPDVHVHVPPALGDGHVLVGVVVPGPGEPAEEVVRAQAPVRKHLELFRPDLDRQAIIPAPFEAVAIEVVQPGC